MNYNRISINAYTRGSTTAIKNAGFDYDRISGLRFDTYWPGGLFGSASFYAPRDIVTSWAKSGAYKIKAINDLTTVYEGFVDGLQRTADQNTSGIDIRCVGAWGNILDVQTINKPWWDDRTSDDVWIYKETTHEEDFDYQNIEGKIHLSPVKQPGFASGDYAAVEYKAPTGQTVKRIKYTYDFAEDSGTWELSLWRSTDGVNFTQMTNASGESYTSGTTTVITAAASATIDVTLGTPSRWLQMRFYSRAANNPSGVAHIHGMMYDVSVRTETDTTMTAAVIIADVLATCTDLNSSTAFLSAPTVDIAPFITDGQLSYADIIMRALAYGGSSGANYYAQILESDWLKQGADGKPILRVGAYPAVTSSYEYELSLNDLNLQAPFTLDEAYDNIYNWIAVEYVDKAGNAQTVTPDDDATLTDATSVSKYGKRCMTISAGQVNPGIYLSDMRVSIRKGNRVNASQAAAIAYGVRYLTRYKNPSWRLTSPISVMGYIRKRGDIRKPCSEIRAGERVLFSNFPASPVSAPLMGSSPLISIISQTSYTDDNGGVNSLSFGDLSGLW